MGSLQWPPVDAPTDWQGLRLCRPECDCLRHRSTPDHDCQLDAVDDRPLAVGVSCASRAFGKRRWFDVMRRRRGRVGEHS